MKLHPLGRGPTNGAEGPALSNGADAEAGTAGADIACYRLKHHVSAAGSTHPPCSLLGLNHTSVGQTRFARHCKRLPYQGWDRCESVPERLGLAMALEQAACLLHQLLRLTGMGQVSGGERSRWG